jgi:hypothetical protein
MNALFRHLVAGLTGVLLTTTAAAQGPGMGGMGSSCGGPGQGPCPGMGGMGPGRGGRMMAPADCSKARDPQRCEARNKALEACKELRGPGHRQCMQDRMPPADCSKAPNPQRCEQHRQAFDACKDKVGPEFRDCMRDRRGLPPGRPGPAPKPGGTN